ncbi:recombinase family protein [Mesorhizobium sp.]|uniref:recombinase family protein n=1 Tax=Mesorhizobium sp. TaxID=1871066 RepID=UPI000FE55851|nr:recombinase family protein [Mesorhizobium sp.]RWN54137.1 MAG: recombinase family protein [Mesorhizobium sp.]
MASEYNGMMIGFARTSTLDQEAGLEAQLRDLKGAGCQKIFQEQRSSVDAHRVQLVAAIDYAREGDVLVVTKLDRLARSVGNLVDIQRQLEAKGVTLRILALNLDTATPTGKLMVNLIGSVAQFEREIMLERQREGIAKAKGDGRYKGRAPTALRKANEIRRMKAEGRPVPEIVAALKVSRASVFRILKATAVAA